MSVLKIPKKVDEKKAWIKYQLSLRGLTFSELARRNDVSRATIHSALTRKYPRMERIIAEAIDVRPEKLWPERYRVNTKGGSES